MTTPTHVTDAGQAAEPAASAADLLPVLWLCGAPAAGKSVTAWRLFQAHHDQQVAYVDIDQLKMLSPEPDDTGSLAATNLATLARQHRLVGTRALIVSGVIEPHELDLIETALAGDATVTWCLVDADDQTLRDRVAGRGWPGELADMVVADAHALRAAAKVQHRIDTTHRTPDEASRDADALVRLRHTATPPPGAAPADASSLLVIHGPRAVGKSTISWGLFMDCSDRGESTGYLDADQLGFVHAIPALRDHLILQVVTTMAVDFARAGAVRTIVNGNLSPALVSALAGAGATLVELDATDRVLADRIADREGNNPARLTGDDLETATPETRAAVLDLARRQRDAYAGAAPSVHRIDVSSPDTSQHVAAIRELLDTPPRR